MQSISNLHKDVLIQRDVHQSWFSYDVRCKLYNDPRRTTLFWLYMYIGRWRLPV